MHTLINKITKYFQTDFERQEKEYGFYERGLNDPNYRHKRKAALNLPGFGTMSCALLWAFPASFSATH